MTISGTRDVVSGRPMVELPSSATAAGGRSGLSCDLAEEVQELAALLAEVVELAGSRAMFPGRWAHVAELAMGHDSVRRALLDAREWEGEVQLRGLLPGIGDEHAR